METFRKKKSKNRVSKEIFTVVTVSRGIAENAYCFKYHKDALRYLNQFKKGRNLDEDDVQIFENYILD